MKTTKEKLQQQVDELRKQLEIAIQNKVNFATEHNGKIGHDPKRKHSYATRHFCLLLSEQRKIERKINNLIYNFKEVKQILKSFGIDASKSYATRIRGWRDHTSGWSFDTSGFMILGHGNKHQDIVRQLKEEGFDIKSFNMSRGQSGTGSIRLEVVFNPLIK